MSRRPGLDQPHRRRCRNWSAVQPPKAPAPITATRRMRLPLMPRSRISGCRRIGRRRRPTSVARTRPPIRHRTCNGLHLNSLGPSLRFHAGGQSIATLDAGQSEPQADTTGDAVPPGRSADRRCPPVCRSVRHPSRPRRFAPRRRSTAITAGRRPRRRDRRCRAEPWDRSRARTARRRPSRAARRLSLASLACRVR